MAPRHLKPRSLLACPVCCSSSARSPDQKLPPLAVRPWREVKSRRGAPKRVSTEGFACPNPACQYYEITDAQVHASSGRWELWASRADPNLSLPGLSDDLQCSHPHAVVSPENTLSSRSAGVECSGRRAGSFRSLAGLIYGQVKKSERRRKLVRVTPVMRLGTSAALTVALQELGLTGRLNTAFIERVNLTVRHGVAALARRTWATAKLAPQLLAHLEWWRAYYHFVRPHLALRVALVQPQARGGKLVAQRYRQRTEADGCRENEPKMDGARGARLPTAAGFRLRASKARCGGSVMSWGGRRKYKRWPVRATQ
jgi:hypothetical protein